MDDILVNDIATNDIPIVGDIQIPIVDDIATINNEIDASIPIIKNILFVNSAVLSLDPYINSETVVIGYDSGTTTTTDEMMQRFLSVKTDTVNRIGFAFHYSLSDPILFLNQEPFFTDSDLGEAQDLVFSPNVQFMLELILRAGGGITHVDFLACDTLQNEKWRLFYQLLQLKTGIMIGASDDNTGNMKYGGDWIMESTHEEVVQIYFTSAIENWAALLVLPTGLNQYYHTFYTMNAATNPNILTRTIYDNAGMLQDTQNISFGETTISNVLSLMDGGGTNPYAIGIVDSSLNKICMDVAFCGVYTKALTQIQQTKLMTHVNTTFLEPHTYMTAIYTVTVNNGAFVFKNSVNVVVTTPISLTSGLVYLFDQSDNSNSGKILRLSSTSPSLTEITSGVTTNGTPGIFNACTIISPSTTLSVYGYLPPQVTYTVTVVGGVYWISTDGATAVQKPQLTLVSGTAYTFDQSHASNVGYPLQLTLHAGFPTTYAAYNNTSTAYTTGVVTTGTSVTITVDANTPQPLYYYCTNAGDISMGYIPPLALIKYTFEFENETDVLNSGTAGSGGNGTLYNTANQLSYVTTDNRKSLYNNTNGSSCYVRVGAAPFTSGGTRTYCLWVKFINPHISGQFTPFTFEGSAASTNGVIRNRDLFFTLAPADATQNSYKLCINHVNSNPAYFFGKYTQMRNIWKHITIVDGPLSATIYTDGVRQGNAFNYLGGTTIPTNANTFSIMTRGLTTGQGGMVSYVDDYRIYDCALTNAEILSIYQNSNYNF